MRVTISLQEKSQSDLILGFIWVLMDGSLFHLSIIIYAVAVVSSAELLWYIGEKCLIPENGCPEASGCSKMLILYFPLNTVHSMDVFPILSFETGFVAFQKPNKHIWPDTSLGQIKYLRCKRNKIVHKAFWDLSEIMLCLRKLFFSITTLWLEKL